jgi:hypothetical protein
MELEPNFETNLSNFMPAVFEYHLASHTSNNNRTGMRHSSSSSTPSDMVHNLSSIDGDGMIGMELDGEATLLGREDRRSDSVDKELLTPAQSRRKAQNRAA